MDVREFANLYRLKIPALRHWEYYISVLHESPEFSDIYKKLTAFGSIQDSELRAHTMHRLIDVLSKTAAYQKMKEAPIKNTRPEKKLLAKNDYEYYLSLDIYQGNWTILKMFDDGEIPASWEEFCRVNDVHEAFILSKPFRQTVFGHLAPKHTQKLQCSFMAELANELEGNNITVSAFSHDEIVVLLGSERYQNICKSVDMDSLPVKSTLFRVKTLTKERAVHHIYKDSVPYSTHSTLHGIPGNEFFPHFKHYVLDQPLEKRDMYFEVDGKLAQWRELPSYMGLSPEIC